MSTAARPGLLELEMSSAPRLHVVERSADPVPHAKAEGVRRRASVAQGQALERLGHAVEYLVDSRLFQVGEHNQRDEQEAVQILMRLSRAVFAECPEVISLRRRLRLWLVSRVARDSQAA